MCAQFLRYFFAAAAYKTLPIASNQFTIIIDLMLSTREDIINNNSTAAAAVGVCFDTRENCTNSRLSRQWNGSRVVCKGAGSLLLLSDQQGIYDESSIIFFLLKLSFLLKHFSYAQSTSTLTSGYTSRRSCCFGSESK